MKLLQNFSMEAWDTAAETFLTLVRLLVKVRENEQADFNYLA